MLDIHVENDEDDFNDEPDPENSLYLPEEVESDYEDDFLIDY